MDVPVQQRLMSLVGLLAMVAIAWLLSRHRRTIPWRVIGWGLFLQLSFGVLVLKTAPGIWAFRILNDAVLSLLSFTEEGTAFVFGEFASERFTIALNVLPTIVFFSALMTILYYLGVMQRVVSAFAWLMRRTMRTSGPETLSVAANSFVGMTEAPLMIAPFVGKMTLSELMAVMTGGFATVAGGVLAAYVGMLKDLVPNIAGHLIAASVMSAPAALVVAKVMWPETEEPEGVEERATVARTDDV
ncbi:MAG: Na+ dependent nucleoside transporter N-terminal domain-containing protein, partial [Myxococcota bacterium]